MDALPNEDRRICRILALDGGGAKGFYTLGVLQEVEAMLGVPLCERFDLVFGTSTGAIIAALIALGEPVSRILALYEQHVPTIMRELLPAGKTRQLSKLASDVFRERKFTDMRTNVGIVATKWRDETPMIFKSATAQAHGREATFVAGFGVGVGDAVEASCSAFPFFKRKTVTTSKGAELELVDGGYCANNPTLYAIADATNAFGYALEELRVVSIGVGNYPEPKRGPIVSALRQLPSVRLLQKTLEINTKSMEQLRSILYPHVSAVRIDDTFSTPEMATDLFEHDLAKLGILRQRGEQSFAREELTLRGLLM